MFCDFMSARAVRGSDFIQISLISGLQRNAIGTVAMRKCPSVECIIVRIVIFCSVRPEANNTIRTIDGGIERNSENYSHRT